MPAVYGRARVRATLDGEHGVVALGDRKPAPSLLFAVPPQAVNGLSPSRSLSKNSCYPAVRTSIGCVRVGRIFKEGCMLILTRRVGETIMIGDEIRCTVLSVRGQSVRVGIDAPHHVAVHREEVYRRIQCEASKVSCKNEAASPQS